MARKSRRPAQASQKQKSNDVFPSFPSSEPPRYKTGIYARLSLKDLGIEDGDTMEMQIALLRDYVIQHPELELTEVYEDNGWTGTNFQRPEFNHMMEDVKAGKINCIVVKDLSRLGRNYLDAGYYLQKVFPSLQLRFIAIYDGYDSKSSDPDSMLVSMKNIVNDYYSKDISRKISATIDTKRANGPHYLGPPPYGYEMSTRGPKHYVIDKEAAPFVHLIFQWAQEGVSFHQIAMNLTDMNVPTPKQHYERKNKKEKNAETDYPAIWNSGVIRKMVLNQTYAGDFVSNKSYFRKYDPANGRMIPEEEWMIYPDTHEAYISHEAFQALKEHLKTQTEKRNRCIKRNRRQIENPDNPFSTILFCGECGRPMRLMKTGDQDGQKYYKCSGVANRTHVGHPPFRMEFGKLKTIVLYNLQTQLKLAIDADVFLKRLSPEDAQKKLKSRRFAALQMLYSKQSAITGKKQKAFEDLASGILDKETYSLQIAKLEKEAKWLEGDISRAKQRLTDVSTYFTPDNKWLHTFLNARISDELDSRAVHLLIQRIELWHDNQVRIVFGCTDWMYKLQNCIEELKQIEGSDNSRERSTTNGQ